MGPKTNMTKIALIQALQANENAQFMLGVIGNLENSLFSKTFNKTIKIESLTYMNKSISSGGYFFLDR